MPYIFIHKNCWTGKRHRSPSTSIFRCVALFRSKVLCFFSLNFIICASAWGHEDFDLGISSLTFNNQCKPIIELQNYGTRALPATFYLAVNPAFIQLRKEAEGKPLVISSKSISALDKKRALLQPGGKLRIELPQSISNNPTPLSAQLMVQGEFWDYGQANDTRLLAEDCVVGKGPIPGTPLPQAPADLSITEAHAEGCKVTLTLANLNKGFIQNSAYSEDPAGALVVSVYEHQQEKRLPSILLKELDPNKTLLTGSANLTLKLGPGHYTVSLWQAQGDGNFANNHKDVDVKSCTQ